MLYRVPPNHATPRQRQSFKTQLITVVATAAALTVGSGWILHAFQGDATKGFTAAVPVVTLSSDGQSANRISIDTTALHLGADVVVPIRVTNASNQALSGVLATLESAAPGMQLVVDTASRRIGPNSSVEYKVRVHETTAVPNRPGQVVVAISPAAS